MTAAQWDIPPERGELAARPLARPGGGIVPFGLFGESAGQHLRLVGEVDVHTVADLRLDLFEAIDLGDGDLIIDCSDVRLVDATGLGVLLAAHRRAQRAGRRLVLANARPELVRLLHVSRLARVLTVERPAA